ncbi:cell division cycle protein 20 [Novymonas esmeraldas]|uniref:Cell division cycle protein 20 n=1 Tax=Novymonas esmeraldas TaxID=1808958 RepID=A0AAW0F0T0_9TRYP
MSWMDCGTPPRGGRTASYGDTAVMATPCASPSSPAPRRPGEATPISSTTSHLRGASSSVAQRLHRRHAQRHASLSPTPSSSHASVDRYVAAPARSAASMARFLLTSRERKTPQLIRAVQQQHLSMRSPSHDPSSVMSSSLEDAYTSPGHHPANRSASRHGAVALAASPRPHSSLSRAGSASMRPGSARLSDVFAKMHLDPSAIIHGSRERSGGSPYANEAETRGGRFGDAVCSPPVSAMEHEPYTTKLARTLFSEVEQTTVLSVNDTTVRPLDVSTRGTSEGSRARPDAEVQRPPSSAASSAAHALHTSRSTRGRLARCGVDENSDGEDDPVEATWYRNEEEEAEEEGGEEYDTLSLPPPPPLMDGGRAPLAMAEVNQFGMPEGARFDASLGVVFECNRSRNFTTPSFRVIPHTPERILDAADMEDDFYMNLIDWSAASDVLCVALQSCVYLWDAKTCGITELPRVVDASGGHHGDGRTANTQLVCGLSWAPDGRHLGVGRNSGAVEVWDVETQQMLHTYRQHTDRTVSLSWEPQGGCLLASGSRDSTVVVRDVRERDVRSSFSSLSSAAAVLRAHETEVCGLRWSPTAAMLASGGNDNQLLLWDRRCLSTGGMNSSSSSGSGSRGGECRPVWFLNKHTAAVKALSWNPTQPTLLASGGGSHDKTLRFWNALTGECVHHVNTGSQVCGVVWNHAGTELVTAHGYTENQLSIWRYPSLRRIANLIGHTSRVLHLALSADGQTVVSAAGDETLRFWRCFPRSELRESSPQLHRSSYVSPHACSLASTAYGGVGRCPTPAAAGLRGGSLSQDRDAHGLLNEEVELR